jgi:hypothetical protein
MQNAIVALSNGVETSYGSNGGRFKVAEVAICIPNFALARFHAAAQ